MNLVNDFPFKNSKWISSNSYSFKKGTSPIPFTFRRRFTLKKALKHAFIRASALGIYELRLNGEKIGSEYFAPGFTSYKNIIQYNEYDITPSLKDKNELIVILGGGWAVGRFTYSSKSKITSKRQSFIGEIILEYGDGTIENISTDSDWEATLEGNFRFGDFYDGEIFDARVNLDEVNWVNADIFKPKFKTNLVKEYGPKVIRHEIFKPIASYQNKSGNETIYDFGQNFAGIVSLKINAKRGQKIIIHHAEIILDGELCLKSLRSAKQELVYICKDGNQIYSPSLTYMGFRYIGVSGIDPSDIEIEAVALYSDIKEIGSFECSNPLLNKLQSNIVWSGKSNFVDIPTDCPQRDERMGWTGDIAIFARTATYNFDTSSFFRKWLKDLSFEQGRGGGIPLVVPKAGISAPVVATACWGDVCVLLPYAEYLSRGDKTILSDMYPTMKKFIKAATFWSSLYGMGKYRRHIWKWLFQFGDWCAPYGGVKDWMKKGKWTATAYLANSCAIMADIAKALGNEKDSLYYRKLNKQISEAYLHVFCNKDGSLKQPFQTGYVLPLYFNMVAGEKRKLMAKELNRLVIENDYKLNTGFVGTPYLLFALADNGYSETAYKVLLQEKSPSWLYGVLHGATTLWEQWSILDENNNVPDIEKRDNIPSFNHYAYGAVGDFLYRRVLGIEAKEAGYKKFIVKPLLGGGLTYAKGGSVTPYGLVHVEWKLDKDEFEVEVDVPEKTICELYMPSGEMHLLEAGHHQRRESIQ